MESQTHTRASTVLTLPHLWMGLTDLYTHTQAPTWSMPRLKDTHVSAPIPSTGLLTHRLLCSPEDTVGSVDSMYGPCPMSRLQPFGPGISFWSSQAKGSRKCAQCVQFLPQAPPKSLPHSASFCRNWASGVCVGGWLPFPQLLPLRKELQEEESELILASPPPGSL